ncbi:TPA: LysR family transcriptional regulator [Pseudomonas putida]|nr:LysR family transcriptional regulator [Pseudomonas putida]MDD2152393.1 LysR family transcriptional regulator [Pseudomonas putida]HDS1683940.1 LysR family transcriptional regulator [Pseudomonas putida]
MAARELGLTQAAVSTQIRQLEGNLGGGPAAPLPGPVALY